MKKFFIALLLILGSACALVACGTQATSGKPQSHVAGEWVVVEEPTCLEKGVQRKYCLDCDIVMDEEEVDALGHDTISHEAKEAECLNAGWEAYETCSRCSYTTYEKIPALGHDKILHGGQAVDCTTDGWEAYETCSRCEYTTYEVIPAAHDILTHAGQAEDCTTDGWEAYETCSRCKYTTYKAIPAAHDEIPHEGWEAGCIFPGWEDYVTCSRCEYTTYEVIPAGHDIVFHEGQAANCTTDGWEAYEACSRCDEYTTYRSLAALGHSYGTDNICDTCKYEHIRFTRVDANGYPSSYGSYLLFGNYPQTKETNLIVTDALTAAAGTTPTASNSRAWTSYGYYQGTGTEGSQSNRVDYMWYQDLFYGGVKYRGVYFTSYRPVVTYGVCPVPVGNWTTDPIQYTSGFSTSVVYWFKYEPVKWKIIEEENGYATLLCDMIIDSQEYYHSTSARTINGKTIYENNYAESNIRKWLNDNFYETAFCAPEQAIVQTVAVDNSTDTTNGYNQYTCETTRDKVWLLSYQEAKKWMPDTATETELSRKVSDYAKCQGATYATIGQLVGNGAWWLRSPHYYSNVALNINGRGGFGQETLVNRTTCGVCPVVKIALA